jgi:hypothetical protein
MRRSTPILLVLLLASLLANGFLAVRLSRRPEPDPVTGRKAAAERSGRPEDSVATLKESLDAERKKNEELRTRIERLETDKKVLVQETPGASAPGKAEKLAAFREKLRKLFKMMKDPAAKAGAVDPDSMVELTDTMMEFFKMSATRTKDPKTYADYLNAFYEIGLEGEGTSLTADQSAALSKLFQEYGEGLGKIPQTPAGEKLLKEIELEAATMARVKTLLTEQQRAAMAKDNMDALAGGNMLSMSYISSQGAADQIAKQWTALYQLDAAQLPQATTAAQQYVDAMKRLNEETKTKGFPFAQQGTPEAYDYRLRSAREQLAALQTLSASMTSAQQEKLRTQTMREIYMIDGGAAVTVPADK